MKRLFMVLALVVALVSCMKPEQEELAARNAAANTPWVKERCSGWVLTTNVRDTINNYHVYQYSYNNAKTYITYKFYIFNKDGVVIDTAKYTQNSSAIKSLVGYKKQCFPSEF